MYEKCHRTGVILAYLVLLIIVILAFTVSWKQSV